MSDGGSQTGREGFVITRERLLSGAHLAAIRKRAAPDFPIRSDEEIEASLDEALAGHAQGEDLWVFGYGSLMWNPAFLYDEQRLGTIRGWHRRFCLNLTRGRGSPDCPGLMLALDRGGACRGMAFRIAAQQARDELRLVWRREMLSGSYLARWVRVATEAGPVRAVTFVVNPDHARYIGFMDEAEAAERIRRASGELGSCLDYFDRTVASLQAFGLRDAALERIARAITRD
ncbi:gamma-glutamylcyclotransferase [Enterovirga rhinocerotis]|uniref:gamma-glutamylcyclotransferase n=1 Tax=Enterovirga rhinocerotis TaxID=1339210 RepID=UPI001FE1E1DF|nr:gamma-glutamylcyclotransferase [Enterovirga rhinocerotis]